MGHPTTTPFIKYLCVRMLLTNLNIDSGDECSCIFHRELFDLAVNEKFITRSDNLKIEFRKKLIFPECSSRPLFFMRERASGKHSSHYKTACYKLDGRVVEKCMRIVSV